LGTEVWIDGRKVRDIYLEMLSDGTSILLYLNAASLALQDPANLTNEALHLYHSLYAMRTIWDTQRALIYDLQRLEGNDGQMRLLDFAMNGWNPSFGVEHFCVIHSELKTVNINTNFTMQGGLNDERTRQNLARLREADERRWQNLLGGLLESGAIFTLAKLNPAVAPILSFLSMFASGSAGAMDGISEFFGNELVIGGVNLAMADIMNAWMELAAMSQALSDAERAVFMGWFGSGGTFTMEGDSLTSWSNGRIQDISFEGLYNPTIIRNLALWQSQGIGSWLEGADREVYELVNHIDFTELSENAQRLITGPFSIAEGENSMSMEEFIEGIQEIQNEINRVPSGHDNLQHIWQGLTRSREGVS